MKVVCNRCWRSAQLLSVPDGTPEGRRQLFELLPTMDGVRLVGMVPHVCSVPPGTMAEIQRIAA